MAYLEMGLRLQVMEFADAPYYVVSLNVGGAGSSIEEVYRRLATEKGFRAWNMIRRAKGVKWMKHIRWDGSSSEEDESSSEEDDVSGEHSGEEL